MIVIFRVEGTAIERIVERMVLLRGRLLFLILSAVTKATRLLRGDNLAHHHRNNALLQLFSIIKALVVLVFHSLRGAEILCEPFLLSQFAVSEQNHIDCAIIIIIDLPRLRGIRAISLHQQRLFYSLRAGFVDHENLLVLLREFLLVEHDLFRGTSGCISGQK